MPKFKFTAMDAKGKETQGSLQANDQATALAAVRKKGLFPTKVEEEAEGTKKTGGRSGKKKGGMEINLRMPRFLVWVNSKKLMEFTRQLSILINAGLPLLRSLNVMVRQERNIALKHAIQEIADSIQAGATLAESLAQHPRIFDRLYVNMVKAGEMGGILDQILDRLAEFMEKAERIKGKVISAMVYPVVVLTMALGILAFLMIVIVPKFQDIFKDLLGNAGLPPLTQFVMDSSTLFTTRAPYAIVVIVGVIVLWKLARRTAQGRYLLDKFKLRLPIFGSLSRKTSIANFARTLGTLMNAGVPVLQALMIVRDTSRNEVLARAVMSIHDSVKEGENMAPPIEDCGVFPPMVISMVEVGEETGELPNMLIKVANTYDEEIDNAVAGMTSIIEPLLIIFLALIVGTIVIALFMPLITIIGRLS